MDKNMEIISQLMVTITQTNEWFRICHEDAQIQRATLGLQAVMERVAALVPDGLMDELWDALGNLEEAQETAAILYGIRVADAIRDVAARPTDLTRYIIDRAKTGAQGGTKRNG